VGDLFGASVAPVGTDIIIGAPFAAGSGEVYRFDRTGTVPSKTYDPPAGATAFGTVLATVGRDFAVSAPGGDPQENPAAFVIDGATGDVIATFFPLVPIAFRDRFDPPLAAQDRNVLVEDALFKFCGRACVEGCGQRHRRADLGETCDAGDEADPLCPNCVEEVPTTSTTSSTSTTTSVDKDHVTSSTSTSTTSTSTSTSTGHVFAGPDHIEHVHHDVVDKDHVVTSTTTTSTLPPSTTSTTTSPTSTSPQPSVTSTSTTPHRP
jgi:hypothetical protein